MTFKKTLLCGLSILMLASTCFANEYQENSANIHQTTAHMGATQCCAEFYISTKVGHLVNNVCQYAAETKPEMASSCEVIPYGVFHLNGQILQHEVGNQWDCAATHLKTEMHDVVDPFTLVKDAQGNFVDSNPKAGSVDLPLCRAKK